MTDAPEADTPPSTGALVAVDSAPAEVSPSRGQLLREFALFQVKLLVDGLKDLLLSPLSMGVLLVGLIAPGRVRPMWRALYSMGRALDDWIDLFPDPRATAAAESRPTMDSALGQTEALVRALRRGGVQDPHVQAQLSAVLKSLDTLASSAGVSTATPGANEADSEGRA